MSRADLEKQFEEQYKEKMAEEMVELGKNIVLQATEKEKLERKSKIDVFRKIYDMSHAPHRFSKPK